MYWVSLLTTASTDYNESRNQLIEKLTAMLKANRDLVIDLEDLPGFFIGYNFKYNNVLVCNTVYENDVRAITIKDETGEKVIATIYDEELKRNMKILNAYSTQVIYNFGLQRQLAQTARVKQSLVLLDL
jgi:hypothetical protein